jgi:(E)-4-hydroxy-3-methylbut-2-enyl-diphosphate synthase
MYTHRKNTRKVMVGDVEIGGNNSVIIQSMTTTKTKDVDATVAQIKRLEDAGCEIVRCTCPTIEDANAIREIKKQVNIPVVADIHFDYKCALAAIEAGADKIRINPGNIGKREKVEAVVNACKEKNIPIRIGVNAGSLEKHIMEKYGYPTAEGMLESAKFHVSVLEELDFHDIIISMKASNIDLAMKAYHLAAEEFDYPLHLGITEAGTTFSGTIKSSIGLGILINEGIGSTIRVSLSADPVEEIKVAKEILKNFGLVHNMPTLISCPTCGRLQFDLFEVAKEVEDFLETIKADIDVAILGCAVNGPGEAKEADIGIAGGKGEGLLFKKGKIVRKIPEDQMVEILKEEILKMVNEK